MEAIRSIKFIVFPVPRIPYGSNRVHSNRVRPGYFPEVGELVGVQGHNQGVAMPLAGDWLVMVFIPVHAGLVTDINKGRRLAGL